MPNYTKLNIIADTPNMAAEHDMAEYARAHFPTAALNLDDSGVSLQQLRPNQRQSFGHRHTKQEELYVVIAGTAKIKVDDDVVDLKALDAIRVSRGAARQFAAGEKGATYLAFSSRVDGANPDTDAQILPDWWQG